MLLIICCQNIQKRNGQTCIFLNMQCPTDITFRALRHIIYKLGYSIKVVKQIYYTSLLHKFTTQICDMYHEIRISQQERNDSVW